MWSWPRFWSIRESQGRGVDDAVITNQSHGNLHRLPNPTPSFAECRDVRDHAEHALTTPAANMPIGLNNNQSNFFHQECAVSSYFQLIHATGHATHPMDMQLSISMLYQNSKTGRQAQTCILQLLESNYGSSDSALNNLLFSQL